jgi:hypothetical protein
MKVNEYCTNPSDYLPSGPNEKERVLTLLFVRKECYLVFKTLYAQETN